MTSVQEHFPSVALAPSGPVCACQGGWGCHNFFLCFIGRCLLIAMLCTKAQHAMIFNEVSGESSSVSASLWIQGNLPFSMPKVFTSIDHAGLHVMFYILFLDDCCGSLLKIYIFVYHQQCVICLFTHNFSSAIRYSIIAFPTYFLWCAEVCLIMCFSYATFLCRK